MSDPGSIKQYEEMTDEQYEQKFEFPLWKLIKQRAEEKNVSYMAACSEVVPEYVKTIRYRDEEFEKETVNHRAKELGELFEREGAGAGKIRELAEEYEIEMNKHKSSR